jgi:hypothetical protein
VHRHGNRWNRRPRTAIVPICGMLIISMCLRLKPHFRSSRSPFRRLFGCAPAGVPYVKFSAVHESRLLTPRLSIVFCTAGSLSDTFASSVPNVGMTPVLLPERK